MTGSGSDENAGACRASASPRRSERVLFDSPSAFIASCTLGRAAMRSIYALRLGRRARSMSFGLEVSAARRHKVYASRFDRPTPREARGDRNIPEDVVTDRISVTRGTKPKASRRLTVLATADRV